MRQKPLGNRERERDRERISTNCPPSHMAVRKARKSTPNSRKKEDTKSWRLFCYCKRPESAGWIVRCANCTKWYHGECIGFPENLRPRIDKIYCRRCQQYYKLSSILLPKCRSEACNKPAAEGSEYCSAQHREEFWTSRTKPFTNSSDNNAHILKWLAQRCGDDYSSFTQASPENPPKPPKPPNTEQMLRIKRLENAIEVRERENICGFDTNLFSKLLRPLDDKISDSEVNVTTEVCQVDPKECLKHKNWTNVARKRLEGSVLDDEERTTPNPAWLAKRAKYLVAGTTRFSRRKGWKAAYFLPYIWDDNDRDFFLDNNPEPFWDKYF